MPNMWRVRTSATGIQGGSWLSTMYFNAAGGTAAQAHAAVVTFWTSMKPYVSSNVQMVVEGDVFTVDSATDNVVAVTAVTPVVILGTSSSTPTAAATQPLAQLLTGVYVGGRQIRGRLFLWGATVAAVLNAGTATVYKTAVDAILATLVATPNADWVVYSRKNGVFSAVSSAVVWQELAVLRSRRD